MDDCKFSDNVPEYRRSTVFDHGANARITYRRQRETFFRSPRQGSRTRLPQSASGQRQEHAFCACVNSEQSRVPGGLGSDILSETTPRCPSRLPTRRAAGGMPSRSPRARYVRSWSFRHDMSPHIDRRRPHDGFHASRLGKV